MRVALEHTARKRDAVRLLFILDQAGTKPASDSPPDAVAVIKAEKRLQALDFWVRCPDYLAAELLAMHEASPTEGYLDEAIGVISGEEPEIRRLGMLRFLFGAWEQLDDSMATLQTYGLATVRRNNLHGGGKKRRDFFLLGEGRLRANELAEASSQLAWYKERAALVSRIAGRDSGDGLKARQYKQAEYANARYGDMIGPIKPRVLERINALTGGKKL
jgi:hypothetical protein